jgi:hypothetical protein
MLKSWRFLKNFPLSTIVHIPVFVSPTDVDIWFQDEARIGQQNTTTKLWAEMAA